MKYYPKDLCAEIAYRHMNTDYTATRMLGYLYRVTNPRVEDLIDEMLAILSDRDTMVRKKKYERAVTVSQDCAFTAQTVCKHSACGHPAHREAIFYGRMP